VEQLMIFLHPEGKTKIANSYVKKQKETSDKQLKPTPGIGGKFSKKSIHCNVPKDLLCDE